MAQYLKLSDSQKGIALMVLGILMVLYALNIFAKWLNPIVVISGITLIVMGFSKVGGVEYFQKLLKKNLK